MLPLRQAKQTIFSKERLFRGQHGLLKALSAIPMHKATDSHDYLVSL